MCNACGHSESLSSSSGITDCPNCNSAKIELIPYSKGRGSKMSSVRFSTEMVSGIFLLIGFLFLLFGLSLIGDTLPLGVTFAVLGLLILVIGVGIVTKGECLGCLTGC